MMKKFNKLFQLASLSAALPLTVFGAGFQLNEHSASGLGRAFAGEGAMTDSAAVIARNPAAMNEFNRITFSAAAFYINPEVEVEGTSTSDLAQQFNQQAVPAAALLGQDISPLQAQHRVDEKDIAPAEMIPTFYLVVPVNERWAWGVGAFSNYGLSTDYSADFNGLEFADKTQLLTYNLNGSVSYKVNDQLNVGVGLNLVYADAEIYTSTPSYMNDYLPSISQFNQLVPTINNLMGPGSAEALPTVPSNARMAKLTGDDWAWGWNIGVFWQPTSSTDIGVSYHSRVDLTLDGKIRSDLREELNADGTVDLKLPASAEIAVNQQVTPRLSIQASARFTKWSSFDELVADVEGIGSVTVKEEHWDDAWRYALGATYQLNADWQLRAGYALDKTPVPAHYRTISIPDTDRQWFTVGTGYTISDNLSVDVGYAYLVGDKVDVQEQSSQLQTALDARLSKADAHIFSAQLNYQF